MHLDIKSRAMVLERVELEAFSSSSSNRSSPRPRARAERPDPVESHQGPGDTDRETIAPLELRPYSEDEEKEEPAAPAATGTPGTAPAKKKADEAPVPTSYRATIDNGWQLYVTADPPQLSVFQRFVASVLDGWQRLRGKEPQHPPLITLVVAPKLPSACTTSSAPAPKSSSCRSGIANFPPSRRGCAASLRARSRAVSFCDRARALLDARGSPRVPPRALRCSEPDRRLPRSRLASAHRASTEGNGKVP